MVLENKMDALKDLNTGWCINAYRAKIFQRQKREKKKRLPHCEEFCNVAEM